VELGKKMLNDLAASPHSTIVSFEIVPDDWAHWQSVLDEAHRQSMSSSDRKDFDFLLRSLFYDTFGPHSVPDEQVTSKIKHLVSTLQAQAAFASGGDDNGFTPVIFRALAL
jgi:hypothetical protein